LLGGKHEVRQGLQGGVCAAEDVGVVAGVDGRGDEGGGLGIGTGDGEEVGAWGVIKVSLASFVILDYREW